ILKRAMSRAQEAICQVPFVKGLTERVEGEEALVPPAQATAVGVLVKGKRITIGWLGDSRAYWVGVDGARQLTTDHSWFNDVVSSGAMTAEQALKDKRARHRALARRRPGRQQPRRRAGCFDPQPDRVRWLARRLGRL